MLLPARRAVKFAAIAVTTEPIVTMNIAAMRTDFGSIM
jgi:hypothetical protein